MESKKHVEAYLGFQVTRYSDKVQLMIMHHKSQALKECIYNISGKIFNMTVLDPNGMWIV